MLHGPAAGGAADRRPTAGSTGDLRPGAGYLSDEYNERMNGQTTPLQADVGAGATEALALSGGASGEAGIYVAIVVLMAIVIGTIGLAYRLSALLTSRASARQRPVYLSGAEPREHAMSRFHVRWYLVGLLFLAFDMEMVFMYPWAVVFADIGWMAMVEMGMFLLILLLGVLYAWREGAFRWT